MTELRQNGNDAALALAAIRWYVLSLEKLGNDIYVTDRGKYNEVLSILKVAYRDLGKVRMSLAAAAEDCGPGYVNCNGVCLPDCYEMTY